MLLLRINLTGKTMRVAEGRANKVLAFCVAVMVAILLELLLAANPAHASTFTVTNTDDSGAGSLRQAITSANDNDNAPTIDTITFNISGNGLHTISPTSELPEITEPLIIDGYSQPGASANTLAVGNDAVLNIELSGTSMPTIPVNALVSALRINAANSTVKGLVISNWDQENGVFLEGGATGNKVEGNFIGTDASGINPLGNIAGVASNGDNNTIGGTTAAARNIISDNGFGVQIGNANGGNKVQGNYIGTDKDGTSALGNNNGVVIAGSPNNTIGGRIATARNIISGNFLYGILIFDTTATDNQVQGNYIGTDASGTQPLGNELAGVVIRQGASNNTIGATTATAGNIISDNGNKVGADPSSNTLSGVEIQGNSAPNTATGNSILSNSIFANTKLGIDLYHTNDSPGVTPNDTAPPPDSDTGPNNLQNFPDLTSAKTGRRATTIKGTLNSTAKKKLTIQFFSSPAADPSGNGEGQKFIGQKSITTDSSGNATFTFKTRKKVPKGQVVTATATSHDAATSELRDTSEFSNAVVVS